MTSLSPDTVRRIEDAAAALIAAGTANPTNEQVRAHLGGGSLSHISPVMRAFRARRREQRAEQLPALPPELAQLLTGQLGLLWQAAVKQADADTGGARAGRCGYCAGRPGARWGAGQSGHARRRAGGAAGSRHRAGPAAGRGAGVASRRVTVA